MMAERICKRCLLKDLDSETYFRTIYEYIGNMPPEQKVDTVLYEQRLQICRTCDHLINGMCDLCGCFVEVRAAKKVQHCAESYNKW